MSEQKSVTDRLLELFVYAPVGVALSLAEELPSLVEKGRARVDGQVALARMVGRFAVTEARRQASSRVASALGHLRPPAPQGRKPPSERPVPSSPGADAPVAQSDEAPPPAPAHAGSTAGEGGLDPPAALEATTLPIPDYDALSASQVVRRLAALSGEELEAVRAYEAATRGRRTILARIAQLEQGS